MKKSYIITAAAVLCLIFLSVAGSVHLRKEKASAAVLLADTKPQPDSSTLYTQAAAQTTASDFLQVTLSSARILDLGNQRITETWQDTFLAQDYGKTSMLAERRSTHNYGDYSVFLSDRYAEGTAYLTLNTSCFSEEMSPDAYLNRLPPVSLITPSLYKTAEIRTSGNMESVGFSQACVPEAWLSLSDVQNVRASALAVIDRTGRLYQSSYAITYTQADTDITLLIKAEYCYSPTPAVGSVALEYVPVSQLDAPALLERAAGYLTEASRISSHTEETITCQAGNLYRQQVTDLTMRGAEEQLRADLEISVNLIDYSHGGASSKYHQLETFRNGVYNLETTKEEVPENRAFSAEEMRTYLQNILVGTIMLPGHITEILAEQQEDTIVFTFQGSEELSQILSADACQILYQDPELLNRLADSYETDTIRCTLQVHRQTGLPVASGMEFSGTYTIDDTSYTLESRIIQQYDFLH